MPLSKILLVSAALVGLLAASLGWAAILNVGPTRAMTTINGGLAAANPGDTILIDDGVYNESLIVDMPLTIQAADVGGAIIDAQGGGSGSSVIDVRADTTFIASTSATRVRASRYDRATLPCASSE